MQDQFVIKIIRFAQLAKIVINALQSNVIIVDHVLIALIIHIVQTLQNQYVRLALIHVLDAQIITSVLLLRILAI